MENCRGTLLSWKEQQLQRPHGGSMPEIFKDQQGSHWAGMEGERGRVENAVRNYSGGRANFAGFCRHDEGFRFLL